MIFIFDENLPRSITTALSIFQNRLNKSFNTNHKVEHITNLFKSGTKDPDFIPKFPSNGILITLDIGQQRKWQEKILIDKENVNVIYYRSKKNLNYWKLVLLFINSWQDVLEKAESLPSPFLVRFKPDDVRKYARL